MIIRLPRKQGIYHPRRTGRRKQPYCYVNSVRGIRRGFRLGYRRVDLDELITKADPHCKHHREGEQCRGHVVNTHWEQPLRHEFRDPLRLLHPSTRVCDMTLDEVLRLEARYLGRIYHINPVEVVLQECGHLGMQPTVEPKGDPRFELDWPWDHIAAVSDDCGADTHMYVLRDSPVPGYGERVQPVAARNGIPGKVIH
jgi:hypothetical protein